MNKAAPPLRTGRGALGSFFFVRGSSSTGSFLGIFGFGRTFLEKEHGQNHIQAHLQELTFPILEDSLSVSAGLEVVRQTYGRFPMVRPIVVVVVPTGPRLPDKKNDK